jgi:predicted site-specific integrase-resolvase
LYRVFGPMELSAVERYTTDLIALPLCERYVPNRGMIYGYARVSTDGQSVEAQVAALTAAGAVKVYREVASGAKTAR